MFSVSIPEGVIGGSAAKLAPRYVSAACASHPHFILLSLPGPTASRRWPSHVRRKDCGEIGSQLARGGRIFVSGKGSQHSQPSFGPLTISGRADDISSTQQAPLRRQKPWHEFSWCDWCSEASPQCCSRKSGLNMCRSMLYWEICGDGTAWQHPSQPTTRLPPPRPTTRPPTIVAAPYPAPTHKH